MDKILKSRQKSCLFTIKDFLNQQHHLGPPASSGSTSIIFSHQHHLLPPAPLFYPGGCIINIIYELKCISGFSISLENDVFNLHCSNLHVFDVSTLVNRAGNVPETYNNHAQVIPIPVVFYLTICFLCFRFFEVDDIFPLLFNISNLSSI